MSYTLRRLERFKQGICLNSGHYKRIGKLSSNLYPTVKFRSVSSDAFYDACDNAYLMEKLMGWAEHRAWNFVMRRL